MDYDAEFTKFSVKYPLNPVDVPYINGHVHIKELIGGLAKISLELINTIPGVMHPAHIHTGLASAGGGILIPLNPVIGSLGKSITFIPQTYVSLLQLNAHITVHLSADELGVIVARGDIGINNEIPDEGTNGGGQPPVEDYSKIRLVRVQPNANEITLKNFGTETVNVGVLAITSEFINHMIIGTLPLLEGDWELVAGAEVKFSWILDDSSDVGLYVTLADFANPDDMLDFVQYKSAGNGREAVAVAKGIWGVGDYLDGNPPYEYDGDGTQNGITYWDDF